MQLLTPIQSTRLFLGASRLLGVTEEPRTEAGAHHLARIEIMTRYDLADVPELLRQSHALDDRIGDYVDPERTPAICHHDLSRAIGCSVRARTVARLCGLLWSVSMFGREQWVEDLDDPRPEYVPFQRVRWNARTGDFVDIN